MAQEATARTSDGSTEERFHAEVNATCPSAGDFPGVATVWCPMSWTRTRPLTTKSQAWSETWTAPTGQPFDVRIRTGKPLDVRSLKGSSLGDVRAYESLLRETADRLYDAGSATLKERCPCCHNPSAAAVEVLRVFGVPYVRCDNCGHGFVAREAARLDELFSDSEEHSQTYTDAATLEVRMSQVVRPKVRWTFDCWERVTGGRPGSAVDVGAGGGHMVAGFREQGVDAIGFELSKSSRDFARAAFGIDLRADDFLSEDRTSADLVTMWGLLEYTTEPRDFVAAARRAVPDSGMLVVEVPRLDCLGTVVQAQPTAVVSRHLDPTTHVNCFSDESLATLLLDCGFRPVAAWYFGMDAYELLVQIALAVGGDPVMDALAEPLLALQPFLDGALACDDLLIAACPM